MADKSKSIDPIPDEFNSYEEAAEFWDTHDTIDYPEAFKPVDLEDSEMRRRRYEVELDEDVIHLLREQAQQHDVSLNRLASDLLRRQLIPTSSS